MPAVYAAYLFITCCKGFKLCFQRLHALYAKDFPPFSLKSQPLKLLVIFCFILGIPFSASHISPPGVYGICIIHRWLFRYNYFSPSYAPIQQPCCVNHQRGFFVPVAQAAMRCWLNLISSRLLLCHWQRRKEHPVAFMYSPGVKSSENAVISFFVYGMTDALYRCRVWVFYFISNHQEKTLSCR